MKHLAFILAGTIIFASCGKSHNVISNDKLSMPSTLKNYSHENINSLKNFEGNYDLMKMNNMDNNDCGASIQIVKFCDGIKLLSNFSDPLEFCNVNKGPTQSMTVTFQDNELKVTPYTSGKFQEETHHQDRRDDDNDDREGPHKPRNDNRMDVTNTLKLNNDGTLVKTSNLATRTNHCTYLRR